jgi:hypothetical protein
MENMISGQWSVVSGQWSVVSGQYTKLKKVIQLDLILKTNEISGFIGLSKIICIGNENI